MGVLSQITIYDGAGWIMVKKIIADMALNAFQKMLSVKRRQNRARGYGRGGRWAMENGKGATKLVKVCGILIMASSVSGKGIKTNAPSEDHDATFCPDCSLPFNFDTVYVCVCL